MKVEVCDGLEMPFFPMRPFRGRALLRPTNIRQMWDEAQAGIWVMQPKLNGDRVGLAVIDGKVYAQNRHGGAYRFKIGNAPVFLKLPNRTCFDGEVFKGNFYPFELLACNGKSLLQADVKERVRWARDMTYFLDQPWLFDMPSMAWLLRRKANLPDWEGVVLKQASKRINPYILLGTDTQSSAGWLKRLWH